MLVLGAATPRNIYSQSGYSKNKLPVKDKMNSSNNNKYMFKSYLNVFKWVADRMQGDKVSLGKVNL